MVKKNNAWHTVMSRYLEKDLKCACGSGGFSAFELWGGARKVIWNWTVSCNTRCGWVWLVTQWNEVLGRCSKCGVCVFLHGLDHLDVSFLHSLGDKSHISMKLCVRLKLFSHISTNAHFQNKPYSRTDLIQNLVFAFYLLCLGYLISHFLVIE